MERCPPLPLHQFQVLSSLKTLQLRHSSGIVFSLVEGESCAKYHFPIECMDITRWGGSVKELTQLLNYFPKLSELDVWSCDKITGLGVREKQAAATPEPPSSANKVDDAQIKEHPQRGEEKTAAEAMLLLPSELQKLKIWNCPDLGLHSNPVRVDDNRQVGRAGGGQGLQGLRSLRSLEISGCPSFSSCSSSSSCSGFPFPTSLEYLYLGAVGTDMLSPISLFLTQWQELCLSIKIEKKGLCTRKEDTPKRVLRTPGAHENTTKTHSSRLEKGRLLSVSENPLPLPYVLLDSCAHLWHRLCGIVENSHVSLFPNIPKCVDHYPIESFAFSGWHFFCRFFPPCSDLDGVPLRL
ncbi:uncharacterized protein [Miscanthus floridulus]|uniref:uncharacterized protein n=1 Tax=Miscanthus floridulus TaxID=154761 RepID=UPI0034583627